MGQIEKDEALRQIAEIASVIKSSNTLSFPGRSVLALGIGVLLVPLIEYPTQRLTFGYDFGDNYLVAIAIIHVVFYFIYFNGIRFAIRKLFNEDPAAESHPLLARSLAMERPIIVAIAGSILVLVPIGQGHLAYPFVFILLGILFNLYGRLSRPVIFYISWSYIFLGFLYAALSVYQSHEMWLPFNTYMGSTLIVMGYSAVKGRTAA